MNLKAIYHMLKRWKDRKKIAPYVDLNSNSYYGNGFSVELRKPSANMTYLTTGEHCVIDGKFIFETETGCIRIGDRVHIGGSIFISKSEIIIDDDVTIAWNCLIYDHNSHSVNWEERKNDTEQEYLDLKKGLSPIANKNWDVVKTIPIHICRKVWIGTGVTILKGVTIGEGAVVGAGSVVAENVEPWTVVGGNPAVVLKHIKER